jgi:LacI family transcriptional regulator, galactose operon repressor
LVTRRTRTVAVVVSDITNPFYPQLVEALHEQLGRAGYRMILFNERTDARGD